MGEKIIPLYGSTVEWSNDGSTWAEIPKARNVAIPEITKSYRDTTNLDSPNGFREYTAGLKDGGEITLECYYSKELYAAAETKAALATAQYFRITLEPDEDQSAGDRFEYRGFVTPSIPAAGDIDGDIMLNILVRTTGDLTWTQGAAA